jgi:snRNA-activating protein complex subunit 3
MTCVHLYFQREIREWFGEKNKSKIFDTKKMEDTTFLDLTIKLGKPYLYMHQGDCQHLLIFTDVRYVN